MKNYKNLLVNNITVESALGAMERNSNGILFIVNDFRQILGSLSDGDCRRHFLNGGSKDDFIVNVMNTKVTFLHEKAPVSDKIQLASNFGAVPLVNDDNTVTDVFVTKLSKAIQVSNPNLEGNETKYLLQCVESGWISSGGKFVRDFENELQRYLGGLHCVSVSNGTVALQLALTALGIGEGDEVLVPDLTFGATINAVLAVGALPKIVAVEDENWNLDTNTLREAISVNTKAIIVVDLYGVRCDIVNIYQELQDKGIKIIVDAAESMALYLSEEHDCIADAYTLSFFANKIITTGEGGAILFKSDIVKNRALIQRDHGMSKERRYFHVDIGFNYRLTNMQAAVGLAQMERIEDIILKRKSICANYYNELKDIPQIRFQESVLRASPWLFTFSIENIDIDNLQKLMAANGIDTRRIFIPLSKMPVFSMFALSNCSNSEKIYNSSISLPTYPDLSKEEQSRVITVFKDSVSLLRR